MCNAYVMSHSRVLIHLYLRNVILPLPCSPKIRSPIPNRCDTIKQDRELSHIYLSLYIIYLNRLNRELNILNSQEAPVMPVK